MGALERGRAAFAARAWRNAFEELSRSEPLDPADLDLLATAAYLIGNDEACATAWTRAYHRLLEEKQHEHAARAAFWLNLTLQLRGQDALASGWHERVQRLAQPDSVEAGFARLFDGLPLLWSGDAKASIEPFRDTLAVAERYGDANLIALAEISLGEALVETDDPMEGFGLLDHAMITVTTDEVSPIVCGLVYCATILVCQRTFDVRRAQQWTTVLNDWCATQPDLVPFRGQCMIHRAELMTMRGVWPEAIREIEGACARLSDPVQMALGTALYQRGELHRLVGEFEAAERAYRLASEHGQEPQPGMALLRLAEGKIDAAVASIQRVMAASRDSGHAGAATRPRLLEAFADIMLAAGEIESAREAAEELDDVAARRETPVLRAAACRLLGAASLAEGDARAAVDRLGAAWNKWKELDAPYEVARTRALLAKACRALGDDDGASLHLDAARATFTMLGAAPDLAALHIGEQASPGKLSARELEVLKLIADGSTNREIANALVISERTVARHLSNIFTKLGVASRTAAGAYAFKHDLV
jgi:ATP/maltotriose-dependent transcriptional regulator MalT